LHGAKAIPTPDELLHHPLIYLVFMALANGMRAVSGALDGLLRAQILSNASTIESLD
jgi:hypothetical protein